MFFRPHKSAQKREVDAVGIRQLKDSSYRSRHVPSPVSFLGPRGTFSDQALDRLLEGVPAEAEVERRPCSGLAQVVQEVAEGRARGALVPLENSLEGSVDLTLDLLAHEVDLKLTAEVVIPITHHLVVLPGTRLEDIQRVCSHPQALAQCRHFLESCLPGVLTEATASTAQAAQRLAERGICQAAISSAAAASLYDLEVLQESIEDADNNLTRFGLLGDWIPEPTGRDRTSLVFSTAHEPGALFGVLSEFARAELNLTRIESRPARQVLGEYIFFVDIEGHRDESHVGRALKAVAERCSFYKFLGSYPRAPGPSPAPNREERST